MAKQKISDDRFETWNINGDNKTWLLEEDATITVTDEPAIRVLATSVGNTLNVLGDIVASGENDPGIAVSGADTRIMIGKHSTIYADDGIVGTAAGMRVVNKGEINGIDNAVSSNITGSIRNFGEISGDVAISATGASRIVNGEDGVIQGDAAGVFLGFGSDSLLVNHGLIIGNDNAVRQLSGGDNRLVNTGSILGDILFGSGNDLLDSTKGIINGDVTGGDGNDVYRIGANSINIIEDADEGSDRVYSRISHSLDANVENLYLVGKADGSAWGNDEDNFILGNKGDNTLAGGAGDDYLGGGRGTDIMNGDAGDDFFMFNRGDDHDAITGFTKGDDMIWMTGFEGVSTFADLQSHMSQHDDDVWISMGQGDRLVVMNTDLGTLDQNDFTFLVL